MSKLATLLVLCLIGINCQSAKIVVLTFDDGPSRYTLSIASILNQNSTPATFFFTGEMIKAYPQAAQKIIADKKFTVGNHTWSHPWLTKISYGRLSAEICRTDEEVIKMGGQRPNFFRAPYGDCNSRVKKDLKKIDDYQIVFWDIDSRDWQVSKDQAYNNIIKALPSSQDTAIILMHEKPSTAANTERLLKYFKSQGITIVPLSKTFNQLKRPK